MRRSARKATICSLQWIMAYDCGSPQNIKLIPCNAYFIFGDLESHCCDAIKTIFSPVKFDTNRKAAICLEAVVDMVSLYHNRCNSYYILTVIRSRAVCF